MLLALATSLGVSVLPHHNVSCLLDAWNAVSPQWSSTLHPISQTCPPSETGGCRNFIHDGGGDMYDRGNRIFVRAGGDYAQGINLRDGHGFRGGLDYTGCDGDLQPSGEGDIQYSACLSSTLFASVFAPGEDGIGGFRVEGLLGTSGRGLTEGNVDALTSGPLYGFYKSAHTALNAGGLMGNIYDTSVNHLIITSTPGARHSWDTSNRFDHDDVSFTAPNISSSPDAQTHLHTHYYMVGNVATTDTCGSDEIATAAECRSAAIALGLGNFQFSETAAASEPPGCYEDRAHLIDNYGGRHQVKFNVQPPGQPHYYYSANGPCAQ